MVGNVPLVPARFKPYRLLFFNKSGRTVWSENCSFKPDKDYVKQIAFHVAVRLARKGIKDIKECGVGVVESNVTMLGTIGDFLDSG